MDKTPEDGPLYTIIEEWPDENKAIVPLSSVTQEKKKHRTRTLVCIQCNEHQPQKGRVCEFCRYKNRREYYAERNKQRRVQQALYKDRPKALRAYGEKCQDCGWNVEPAILHVHHLDGNRQNHSIENLQVLCPTCHALRHYREQTGSWDPVRLTWFHGPREDKNSKSAK